LEAIGWIDSITIAVSNIYEGRKGFATQKIEGRLFYENGIAKALTAFQEAQVSADAQSLILAEYTFLAQELAFCDKTDKDSLSSLNRAIEDFDDAFSVLEIVDDTILYRAVDKGIPRYKKYREKGFPKDAFHIACNSHRTRIRNILRSPGIDSIEKSLLKQRFINLRAAQNRYIEQQKKTLES
jgi:hypothetical protein